MKVKKILILSLVVIMLLSSLPSFASSDYELGFNKYGFREGLKQEDLEEELLSEVRAVTSWEQMPSKSGVDLEKVWTVRFSGNVTFNKIDAATIERNNTFIPVKITKTKNDELVISPQDKYAGNANYTLRILLSNGRKYRMDFTTKSEYRKADIEPNDDYKQASKLYLDEIIVGDLDKKDTRDYYKIEVPSTGELRIDGTQLEGGRIGITLYNSYGSDSSYITRDYDGQRTQIITGLEEGTYYLAVYNRSGEGSYIIETNFIENTRKKDKSTTDYITAPKIPLNDKSEGHIGYIRSNGVQNTTDFYRLEVPRTGELRIDGTQLEGGRIGITLYNSYGTDNSYIKRDYDGRRTQIITGLEEGTYYLAVYNRSGYGGYELDVNFSENMIRKDNSTTDYITAPKISINDRIEGHIGYIRSNGVQNTTDFYRLEVPRTGELIVNGTQLEGGRIGITLYNSYGTDNSYITRDYDGRKVSINREIEAGTYYIAVYNRSGYGGYELDLNFQ